VFVPPLPANVTKLRTRIIAAVADVTPEILRSVWQEVDYRWDVCRITSGSSFEPYLSQVKLGVLLHYGSSKHCTCPLNKFILASNVVKLFLKHTLYEDGKA
jgi:hypothetical protein